jgi:hypothetical protein
MEKLLQDFAALVAQARILVSEYQQKRSEAIEVLSSNRNTRDLLDAQLKDVELREIECKKVENAVALMKKASALQDATNVRVNSVAKAEQDLRDRQAAFNDKSTQERLLNEKKAKINEDRMNKIDAEVTARVQEVLKKAGLK